MARFIISRLLQAVAVLFVIVTITFFLVRAAPGGPFAAERSVQPHIAKHIDAYYGLDRPEHEQYFLYLKNLLQGDLGPSYKYEGRTVNEIVGSALPISAQLGLTALVIALVIGIPIGVVAAVRKNRPADYIPMSLSMIGICLPTFVLGPILALVFGIYLDWLNVGGWYDSTDWILPSLTLGLYYAAYIARLSRGGMLEILSQDFIRTARAKGLPGPRIVLKHALKGGLLPVVAYLGPAIAGLISGSFVIEKIFRIPGLGQHFIDAAYNNDYSLILGTVIVYGTAVVILNLIVDVAQILLNPRLSFASAT